MLTLYSFQLPCYLLFYLVSLFGTFDFGDRDIYRLDKPLLTKEK